MIHLFKIKINTGKTMCIIGDINSREKAKNLAVQLSPRFFADDKLHVRNGNNVIDSDEYLSALFAEGKDTTIKEFYVVFLLMDTLQFLTVKSNGPASAYRSIKSKYGIDEDMTAMIFELGQKVGRKDAVDTAKVIIDTAKRDNKNGILENKQVAKVVYDTRVKLAKTYGFDRYEQNITTLIAIFEDFISGRYRDISADKVNAILAALIYFAYPSEYHIDKLKLQSIDELEALKKITNMLTSDILKYKQWVAGDVGEIIIFDD